MPILVSNLPPKINTGPAGPAAWLQKGKKYGTGESGPFYSFSVEGTKNEVSAVIAEIAASGWQYTYEDLAGGMARIEARAGWNAATLSYPGTEIPQKTWELAPEESSKSLLEADFPYSYTSGLNNIALTSSLSAEAIQLALEDQSPKFLDATITVRAGLFLSSGRNYTFNDGGNTPTMAKAGNYNLPVNDYPVCKSLYLLMKKGVAEFPVESSTIRLTSTVSNLYSILASYNNCNRIISTPSMYSLEGVPNALLFSVPLYVSAVQFVETTGDLQYGWRKIRPEITRKSSTKWSIVQNYKFGLWPVRLFGGVL